jgi:uncharacterized protein (TIGR02594 family)
MDTSRFVALLNGPHAETIIEALGRRPPTADDIARAAAVFRNVPNAQRALDVARYFERLDANNSDGEPMNSEWSRRANPVILTFFLEGTDYDYDRRKGDRTAWCAAFVNWCLQRVGLTGTRHPGSRSFRTDRYETAPSEGSIAVFADVEQSGALSDFGHVGFYLAESANQVSVLGGNQSDCVSTQSYLRESHDSTSGDVNRKYLGAVQPF